MNQAHKSLSDKADLALSLLQSRPSYALELCRRSNGRLKPGTVYGILYSLLGLKLVESEVVTDPTVSGRKRVVYRAISKGQYHKNCSDKVDRVLEPAWRETRRLTVVQNRE